MIEERTRLYEVLIRIHPDGAVAGHSRKLYELVKDGAVISAKEMDAEPLATSGPEWDAVVGGINAALLADRDRLAARVAELEAAG